MHGRSELGGIAAMLVATATFVVGDSFMKLVTEDLPPFEVLFLRGIVASLACALLVVLRGEWSSRRGLLDPRALLRAVAETLSTLCYVMALSRMQIADVIAILQTAPLILVLGAAILFHERIGAVQAALVLVGFAGALLVAQPGATGASPAALFAFGSAGMVATRDLLGRGVPNRIPVTVVIFATMVMVMLAGGLASLLTETWVPPGARHLAFLALAGSLLAVGQIALLLAYRLGRTSTIAPFFYSFALWGVVAGLVVWGQLTNSLALAGIAAIVASGIALVLLGRKRGSVTELADAL